ncbi:beta-1,6-N-acetylglucosaminyltransferase [Pedobacter cryoconitis]|uniref:Peptide O-xylosyltransferase n=1 Tax=Pedobacter cryoconitis TaxID=188932 RepID=A0A7X0J861_9SPHI|nr:flavorubredoxin [Pedobacter cryoconitis]
MRIAHIIMAHKNPDQLIRLIKRLHHPEADFYIHIDTKSAIEDFNLALSIVRVLFIKNRVNCNWGGNSLFLGIISSMNEVISLKKNYSFLNLLSVQDYPSYS